MERHIMKRGLKVSIDVILELDKKYKLFIFTQKNWDSIQV